jgi:exodeoxyribonuclease VII small subunit
MNDQSSYARLRERMEEIVVQVRSKDVPLEKSLDLYEEALRLGSSCANMIDRTDFSADELDSILDTATEAGPDDEDNEAGEAPEG